MHQLLLGHLLLTLIAADSTDHLHKEPAIFQTIGEVATDTTTNLIIGRLDITPIQEQLSHIQNIMQYVAKAKRNLNGTDNRIIQKQIGAININLEHCLIRLQEIQQLDRVTPRQKRAAMVMAAALLTIGGALGMAFTNHHLSNSIDELEARQDQTIHYVDAAARQIQNSAWQVQRLNETVHDLVLHEMKYESRITKQQQYLRNYLQVEALISLSQYAVTQATQNIHAILDTWTEALHGQITIELFHPDLVRTTLRKMSNQANGPLRLAFDPTDLEAFYKLPCHTDIKHGKLRIVVPVPVYNIKETFSLYRHLAMPLFTTQGQEMVVRNPKDYLILNEEGTLHQELDQADLSTCLKVRQLYLCPQIRVLIKTATTSCLFALFQGHAANIRQKCPLAIPPPSKGMEFHQVGPETFLVLTRQIEKARITCHNGTTVEREYLPGTTTLTLPNGCRFSTADLYVSATRTGWIGQEVIITRPPTIPPMDLLALINHHQPHDPIQDNELKRMLTQWNVTTTQEPLPLADLTTAAIRAHQLVRTHTSVRYGVATLLVVVGMSLPIIGYAVYRWRHRQNRYPPAALQLHVTSSPDPVDRPRNPGDDTATRTQQPLLPGGNCSETAVSGNSGSQFPRIF
ncbi:uncharacterized protein LOC131882188 [Tigriopus californicus]|uniref:uncharacterized protein LOC131882188 n=1 Tax=Tigriopus californicus TaxID=6832 RepID=UPI0027DAA518|nr:uncharacterized protein LOC131882188 [Tigriopus californicus]